MIERNKWQPAIWLNSDPRSAPYFSIVASWGAVATIEFDVLIKWLQCTGQKCIHGENWLYASIGIKQTLSPYLKTNVKHSLFDLAILATYVLISDYLVKIIGSLDFSLNNKNSNWMLLSHIRTILDIKKGFWTFWGRKKTLEVIGNIVYDQFYWPVYYYYIHPWRKSNPQLRTDYKTHFACPPLMTMTKIVLLSWE